MSSYVCVPVGLSCCQVTGVKANLKSPSTNYGQSEMDTLNSEAEESHCPTHNDDATDREWDSYLYKCSYNFVSFPMTLPSSRKSRRTAIL
jgi:hypothetical protein